MITPQKKEDNWLKEFNSEVGKKISKAWFLTFSNQKGITDFVYGNKIDYEHLKVISIKKIKKGTVQQAVKTRFRKWKNYNFFEVSRDLKIKTWRRGGWYYPTTKLYMLNLEPLYKFCKEKHNIDFNEEERKFLNGVNGLFRSEHTRKLILQEYPEEDIINSILKFYVKHYVNMYRELLEKEKIYSIPDYQKFLNKEGISFFEEKKRKAEELNKKKFEFFKDQSFEQFKKNHLEFNIFPEIKITEKELKKRYSMFQEINKETREKNYDYIDVISHDPNFNFMFDGFSSYVEEFRKNPKVVLSINDNFQKVLGILPA